MAKSVPPKPLPRKTADLWLMVFANYRENLQISEPWRPEYATSGMPPQLRSEVKNSFFKLPREEQQRILACLRSWYFPDLSGLSLKEWLEQKKSISFDKYVQMSNAEKAALFEEYVRIG